MGDDLYKTIYNTLNFKETDELVEIWTTNDRSIWSDTAFEVVKELLGQRLGELPPQNEPVFEPIEEEEENLYGEDMAFSKYTDPDNAPILYEPREVLWMDVWLNRVAIVAIVITIFASMPVLVQMHTVVWYFFQGNPERNSLAWLITIIIGGLATGLQCVIVYFSLKALASILKILMEMEFNSRGLS